MNPRRAPLLLTLFTLALLLACLLPPLLKGDAGYFWSPDNGRFLAAQTGWIAFGALGMMWIVAVGGIDLSAAAIIALAGSATAAWIARSGSPGLALLMGAAAGISAGVINGSVVALLRRSPALITLALSGIYAALALAWAPGMASNEALSETLSGDGLPQTWLGHLLAPFPTPGYLLLAPVFWLALLLAVGMALVMRYTVLGVHLLAVGSNEEAARLCGIAVHRRRTMAYALAGLCFGLAGAMQAGQLGGAPPVSPTLLVELIAAALLGSIARSGVGRVWGTLLGALAVTLLRNAAQQAGWPLWVQALIISTLFCAALLASQKKEPQTPNP